MIVEGQLSLQLCLLQLPLLLIIYLLMFIAVSFIYDDIERARGGNWMQIVDNREIQKNEKYKI